jgi:hypothetical protein
VISEATAVAMLTRFYGWTALEPGTLRRTRKPQPMAMIHQAVAPETAAPLEEAAAPQTAAPLEEAAADRAA